MVGYFVFGGCYNVAFLGFGLVWCFLVLADWFSRLLLDFGLDDSLVVAVALVPCGYCVFGFLASCVWRGVDIIYGLLWIVVVVERFGGFVMLWVCWWFWGGVVWWDCRGIWLSGFAGCLLDGCFGVW